MPALCEWTTSQDIESNIRALLHRRGVAHPTLQDCKELARRVVRSVVPHWRGAGHDLTQSQREAVGREFLRLVNGEPAVAQRDRAAARHLKVSNGVACHHKKADALRTGDPNGVTCGVCRRTHAFRLALEYRQ